MHFHTHTGSPNLSSVLVAEQPLTQSEETAWDTHSLESKESAFPGTKSEAALRSTPAMPSSLHGASCHSYMNTFSSNKICSDLMWLCQEIAVIPLDSWSSKYSERA